MSREAHVRFCEHLGGQFPGVTRPVMERFFGTLKSEWTDARRYRTRQEAIDDVAQFIEWEYNAARGHTSLDYLTPIEKQLTAAA